MELTATEYARTSRLIELMVRQNNETLSEREKNLFC